MGNKQNRQKLSSRQAEISSRSDLSKSYSGQESTWQQYVQIHHCCGIKIEKIKRKKIIWENSFIDNCKSISNEFKWANDMIQLVNNCELSRTKYFNQVNLLKSETEVEKPTETEILSTQAEVEMFKTNLKKSVILSFAQSRHSEGSQKLSNIMETKSTRSRINIERASYLNQETSKNVNGQFVKSMSVASKGSFRRSIISLIDDTISSVMGSEREISKQTARDLQIFLKFSMILERHLGDIHCMLGRIKRLFIVYIEKEYRDYVAASLKIGDFIDNVKQFLALLRETVIDYYNLYNFSESSQQNLFITNQENILSACTAILFKDTQFYSQIFSIISHYNRARESKFAFILDHLQGSTPDRFMVKERFCLNYRTIENYISSLRSSGESMVESIQFKDMAVENCEPYRSCMSQLRDLEKSKSPISKMKAIVNCSESISCEIERFYQRNGLRKEKWMLDADQVLSIFCYILVGAKVENLLTHLFILENFSTSHQMISMSGYYLSVINCAVEQLEGEHQELESSQNL